MGRDREAAPPKLAFDAVLEREIHEELGGKFGREQAREMLVRWMFYQLQAFAAEALRTRVSYRSDLVVSQDDGSEKIVALGGEWLDVREMTLRAMRKFPEDPRIRADHYGWTGLYTQLKDAEKDAVGFLVSPGPEYDIVYLLQIGGQDTPHTRVIHKLMIICKLETDNYAEMINFCRRCGQEGEGTGNLVVEPELEVRRRKLAPGGEVNAARLYPHEFLYFPQVLAPQDLGALWERLKRAAGVDGKDGLPGAEDIRRALGRETAPELVPYERWIKQTALRLAFGLADGEMSVAEAQGLVDGLVGGAVRLQYRRRGWSMPREIEVCGGMLRLDGGEGEMMEERKTAAGRTEYKCRGCGHWVTLDLGHCPHCGYRFKCGGASGKLEAGPEEGVKMMAEIASRDDRPLWAFFSWLLEIVFADSSDGLGAS
jgi:hypothetical protein